VAIQARKSSYRSGLRGQRAHDDLALENLISNAERRAIRTGERRVAARICDLQNGIASISGKVELVYEGSRREPSRWRNTCSARR
jgi:magnesium chelatase subunit I